jgi:hypothetical protein
MASRASIPTCLALAAILAAGMACRPGSSTESGGAASPAPPKPAVNACALYCEKLATCWKTVPTSQPNLSRDDAVAKCRSEHGGCLGAETLDTYCCAKIADCRDFAACQFSAKGTPATCPDASH